MATSKWMKFFTDAGLPPHVAANYSIIFTENRMSVDMLMDLSKEYLYDMGIRLMGDVIAILRHARTAYTEAAQEKFLNVPKVTVNDQYPETSTNTAVDHYLKRARIASTIVPQRAQIQFSPESPVRKKMIMVNRKAIDSGVIQGRQLRLLDHDKLDVQFSDVEKVPSAASSTSKSVFNRLGESSVSSSTDAVGRKGPSIFARLGPNRIKTLGASSTMNADVDDDCDDDDEEEEEEDYDDPADNNNMSEMRYQNIIRTNVNNQQSRDLRARLGTKPTSATVVTTTSPDPLRLIRKSLQDTRSQRQLIGSSTISLRTGNALPRAMVRSKSLTKQPTSLPLVRSTTAGISPRVAPYRLVKKPKNEKTIFDRLGPVF